MKIKVNLRLSAAVILALSLGMFSCNNPEDSKAKRPNIILFLVDDMGWQDTS